MTERTSSRTKRIVCGCVATAGVAVAAAAFTIEVRLYNGLRAELQRRANQAAEAAAAELRAGAIGEIRPTAVAIARRERIRGHFLPYHAVHVRYGRLHAGAIPRSDEHDPAHDAVEVTLAMSRRYGNPHETAFGRWIGYATLDLHVSSVVRVAALERDD